MRGSTRKRGRTWTALWDATDPATGKRLQKSKGGFETRKAAQQHLATVIVSVGEGTYVEPSKLLLGQFLRNEWLPAAKGTVRPLTYANYQGRVNSIAKYPIAAIPLRALSGGHMTALYGELERDGLSVGTRRFTHSVLRRALNDAVRWGKLSRNPSAAADQPAASRSKVRAWSDRELRQFLAHVESDRLYALWRLAATTGMRRGELLGTTWRYLDLDGARLQVEQQLLPTAGGVTFGPPKSVRSERTIALDAVTVDALRAHHAIQQLERDLAADAYADQDLVSAMSLAPRSPPSADGHLREPSQSGWPHVGNAACPTPHGRDDRAHEGSRAARGRRAPRRPRGDDPRDLCAPAPELRRDRRRNDCRRSR